MRPARERPRAVMAGALPAGRTKGKVAQETREEMVTAVRRALITEGVLRVMGAGEGVGVGEDVVGVDASAAAGGGGVESIRVALKM